MSEPEISHRCPSCGASFRTGASFCGQCGGALTLRNPVSAPAPGVTKANIRDTIDDHVQIDETQEWPPPSQQAGSGRTPNFAVEGQQTIASQDFEPQHLSVPAAGQKADVSRGLASLNDGANRSIAAHDSRVTVHRATSAARDVLEDRVLPQVEKLRKASGVVLGEATYDSGLRFIFVAVLLFLMFLVVLLLSKFMG
jgi:hypothetical protein